MAKTETPVENEVVTTEVAGETAPVEAKKAGAAPRIMVTLEDGTQISRQDYIRQHYDAGEKRGDIAKKLTELTGKKVAYQVVFAATKNRPQPAAAASTPAVADAPAEAASAESEVAPEAGE